MRTILVALALATSFAASPALSADFRLARVRQNSAEVIDLAAVKSNLFGHRTMTLYDVGPPIAGTHGLTRYGELDLIFDCPKRLVRSEAISFFREDFSRESRQRAIPPFPGPAWEPLHNPEIVEDFGLACARNPEAQRFGERLDVADWRSALLVARARLRTPQS